MVGRCCAIALVLAISPAAAFIPVTMMSVLAYSPVSPRLDALCVLLFLWLPRASVLCAFLLSERKLTGMLIGAAGKAEQ